MVSATYDVLAPTCTANRDAEKLEMYQDHKYEVVDKPSPNIGIKASWSQETLYPSTLRTRREDANGTMSSEKKAKLRASKPTVRKLEAEQPSPKCTTETTAPQEARMPTARVKLTKLHSLLDDMLGEVRMQYPQLPLPCSRTDQTTHVPRSEATEEDLGDAIVAELIAQAWQKLTRIRECYQQAYDRAYDQLENLLKEVQHELQAVTRDRDNYILSEQQSQQQLKEFFTQASLELPPDLAEECASLSTVEDLQQLVLALARRASATELRHRETIGDMDRRIRVLRKRIAIENGTDPDAPDQDSIGETRNPL